jgi:hypothetical protein
MVGRALRFPYSWARSRSFSHTSRAQDNTAFAVSPSPNCRRREITVFLPKEQSITSQRYLSCWRCDGRDRSNAKNVTGRPAWLKEYLVETS